MLPCPQYKATKKNMLIRAICTFVMILTLCFFTGCGVGGVSGEYVHEKKPKNYIELKSDGTFFLQREDGSGETGKFEIDSNMITLSTPDGDALRCEIKGNTIIDKDGARWTKP